MVASLLELDVVARTLYGEARNVDLMGLVAVAWVIRTRVAIGGWWGDTLTGVCRKPKQFSCWNEGDPNRTKVVGARLGDPSFHRCCAVATLVLLGEYEDPTHRATHYYNPDVVTPGWAEAMETTVVIGRHQFLKRRAS